MNHNNNIKKDNKKESKTVHNYVQMRINPKTKDNLIQRHNKISNNQISYQITILKIINLILFNDILIDIF